MPDGVFPAPVGCADCERFTSLCPVTGQPDWATLKIAFIPNHYLVESKSLKEYLGSFRMHGDFHEDVCRIICATSSPAPNRAMPKSLAISTVAVQSLFGYWRNGPQPMTKKPRPSCNIGACISHRAVGRSHVDSFRRAPCPCPLLCPSHPSSPITQQLTHPRTYSRSPTMSEHVQVRIFLCLKRLEIPLNS